MWRGSLSEDWTLLRWGQESLGSWRNESLSVHENCRFTGLVLGVRFWPCDWLLQPRAAISLPRISCLLPLTWASQNQPRTVWPLLPSRSFALALRSCQPGSAERLGAQSSSGCGQAPTLIHSHCTVLPCFSFFPHCLYFEFPCIVYTCILQAPLVCEP